MRIFARAAVIASLLVFSSCRSLTPNEQAVLDLVYHPQTARHKIDLTAIRVWESESNRSRMLSEARAQLAVELEGRTARVGGTRMAASQFIERADSYLLKARAVTIGNTIFMFDYGLDSSLLAHEAGHVWQWQNRQYTGYALHKVIAEHLQYGDRVYDYVLTPRKRFLSYRYEQQGKIIEDYVLNGFDPVRGKLIAEAVDIGSLRRQIQALKDRAIR